MSEKDNTKLKPAEENPWYVLATICDKWDGDDDVLKHEGKILKSVEVWNSWIIPCLEYEQIRAIGKSQSTGFPGPKWKHIEQKVKARFKRRTNGGELPDVSKGINFSHTTFSKEVDFGCFFFPTRVDFSGSIFVKNVNFCKAFFVGMVSCKRTTFLEKLFLLL